MKKTVKTLINIKKPIQKMNRFKSGYLDLELYFNFYSSVEVV